MATSMIHRISITLLTTLLLPGIVYSGTFEAPNMLSYQLVRDRPDKTVSLKVNDHLLNHFDRSLLVVSRELYFDDFLEMNFGANATLIAQKDSRYFVYDTKTNTALEIRGSALGYTQQDLLEALEIYSDVEQTNSDRKLRKFRRIAVPTLAAIGGGVGAASGADAEAIVQVIQSAVVAAAGASVGEVAARLFTNRGPGSSPNSVRLESSKILSDFLTGNDDQQAITESVYSVSAFSNMLEYAGPGRNCKVTFLK